MIFQTEKQIKEFDEKLTEDDKTELNTILADLSSAHKEQDIDKIDSEINKLNESWSRISTNLYSQASSEQTGTPDTQPDVQDVNFEEVK